MWTSDKKPSCDPPVLSVALTGNVAAGKSTVLGWFGEWGATVIDADVLVREAQAPGSPVLAAIAARFGPAVIDGNGALDRPALRAIMVADPAARRDLNAIVHPAVHTRRAQAMDAARDDGDLVVVNDIPLLFEALDPDEFDVVVLVDAPATVRRDRLVHGRGMSADEADQLMATQMPANQKRARSHHIIENGGALAEAERRAHEVWSELRALAARRTIPPEIQTVGVLVTDGPGLLAVAGTLARYADAGLSVHLWITGTVPPDLATALDPAVLHATGDPRAMTTDLLIAQPGALPGLVGDCAPTGPPASGRRGNAVRLDVRPWIERKTRVARTLGVPLPPDPGREHFTCVGQVTPPADDLFGAGRKRS